MSNVIVFSGISLFSCVSNGKLGNLWDPLDCCGTMAWWSFSERPWPQLISLAIWMLRASLYLSNVIVYSGISLFSCVSNGKLEYLWDPLDCCGTMADGRFVRGHGFNLYHLQCECLGLLSIWEPALYTLDPLHRYGTMADGRFVRGHGPNLYHLQHKYLGLFSVWVTSLYVSVCLVYLPLAISHRALGMLGASVSVLRICAIYKLYIYILQSGRELEKLWLIIGF